MWCVDVVDLKSKREGEEKEQRPNMLGNANQEDHEVLELMCKCLLIQRKFGSLLVQKMERHQPSLSISMVQPFVYSGQKW